VTIRIFSISFENSFHSRGSAGGGYFCDVIKYTLKMMTVKKEERKRVLIVFPTEWDRSQLDRCQERWRGRYEVLFSDPSDEDCPFDFDIMGFIDSMVRQHGGRIHGVMSSSDYPGATAAGAIASRLGLPGASPARLIRASHKYYSRLVQRRAVPEATPSFALIDPSRPGVLLPEIPFPCFIKPVKGAFSMLARQVGSPEELSAFLGQPAVGEFVCDYMGIFNRLVKEFTDFSFDGRYFIAEELLVGNQITVEGYCRGGRVEFLGVTDSAMYPGTGSFMRFDYPSACSPGTISRIKEIARRTVSALGLTDTLFNIEMVYNPGRDSIHLLEINPRMCGQFADLYQKVDDVNGYETALAIASGEWLPPPGKGGFRIAASFPLRTFTEVRTVAAPDDVRIRRAEALFPGTLIWNECQTGEGLGEGLILEDGMSRRYAVINMGGPDSKVLQERLEKVRECLGYVFDRVDSAKNCRP